MKKASKRFKALADKHDSKATYGAKEACELVKKNATAKFDETVEAAFRLGINVKQADQQIRSTVSLPHGTGKTVRVAVIAKGEKLKEAETAGANAVGSDDLIAKIEGGWMEFDILVATPDIMGSLAKLGKLLGPKGLMPNPKSGTVTFEVGKAVKEFQAGKLEVRSDKQGIVHVPVGKASFSADNLYDNFMALTDTLNRLKPASAKGTYLKSVTLSSTMGPGVKLDTLQLAGSKKKED